MLTGELIRSRLRIHDGQLTVKTINPRVWQTTAAALIAQFEAHRGQTRAAWQEAIETTIGDQTDYRVIRGLAKVLADSGVWTAPTPVIVPSVLRESLFKQGPAFRDRDLFTPHTRADLIAMIATAHQTTPDEIETALYADLPDRVLLTATPIRWTPEDLIARYHLELARGVLYWAGELTITLSDSFKDFWRYLKLFKLMFEATPIDGGYQVRLDGAISPFVHATTRYGRQFAAFLPALFLIDRWTMQAGIQLRGRPPAIYRLDQTAPLQSHFRRAPLYDSRLERDFAEEFSQKFGDQRDHWTLQRESEVILLGDTVMIPDFTVTHRDGRRALIEIVGYWHPTYLRRKLAKVRAAGRTDLILLIYERVNLSDQRLDDLPTEVLYFKNKPVIKDVLAALDRRAITAD
ncbi:MAG: DUF790 family protein [Anaerolineae bacterium]|jgi:hypothetical protein|nr:DUF790 family protein [Anaerolineae bacterium]